MYGRISIGVIFTIALIAAISVLVFQDKDSSRTSPKLIVAEVQATTVNATAVVNEVQGTPEVVLSSSTPVPQPEGVSPSDRMVIPKIKVDASLVFLRTTGGEMPAPDGAREIAYYAFPNHTDIGGAVGQGGNAIFAGHVDRVVSGKAVTAVFWDINKLEFGDEIQVRVGGEVFKYKVTTNRLEPGEPPAGDEFYWNRLLASTQNEQITLITCTGNFDPVTRSYDKRRVVIATRVQ